MKHTDSVGEGRGGLALYQYIISCPVPLSDSVHTQHSTTQRHKIIQRLSFGYYQSTYQFGLIGGGQQLPHTLKVEERETDRTELLALEVYRLKK